ncbi:MAG: sigma-70 family RNA polymerase sigma factor [Saprospiraceae bacterium]|nr:sigma-70 family RNA polymerase sigma factor [Saprospiraceae bacterium]
MKKLSLDSLLILPETERIIITLYYEDMPVKEIAEITGMTGIKCKSQAFQKQAKTL